LENVMDQGIYNTKFRRSRNEIKDIATIFRISKKKVFLNLY
jgi:hypothetical protein